MTTDETRHMAHALSLGQRGLGRTWPNPAVGCVIVHGSRIVGRGWTQPGGRPHAEVMALAQAGAHARGATAYVTLEPCAHHGQTGPCAEALITAGVRRVVTAITDPDPRVAGKGHASLRAAGIMVTEGDSPEARLGLASLVEHGSVVQVLRRESCSQISDTDAEDMTHVARGAVYVLDRAWTP